MDLLWSPSTGALMDFTLSNEQELLRNALTTFLSTRYGLQRSRAAAKTDDLITRHAELRRG